MADIRFTPAALQDLQDIRAYIADELFDTVSANRTIEKILSSIRGLEMFPESGTPLGFLYNIETPYRYVMSGNYMAFYKYKGGVVYVVRILYGRRNYIKILFDRDMENEDGIDSSEM